ncbi:MAG: NAD-dependent DNA ligase LigA [Lachnospiraceae bacterium]|nr:NAD-dependent DNA ligase LigA [Lachnospiraceae bacterium]
MTREAYDELIGQIRKYNEAYEAAEPLVSDYEYDQLMQSLKAAEREHPEWKSEQSPSQTVGAAVKREAGVTVQHNVPMLSIEDVFTKEDVISWVHEVRALHPDAAFSVEQKIDGLSMTLRYSNGELKLAETRGDGFIGEDVTLNAGVIPDVLKKLPADPGTLEVRGEVYMSLEDFDRTNESQELQGKKTFANPRNCAAGTLRQLDPEITKSRGLSFFVFNIQDAEDTELTASHTAGLAALRALGMKIVPSKICRTDEEILAEIDRIGEARGSLGYDIDGAVVKIDNIAMRSDFPAGAKYSAGHIAYKYPPEEKETVVREIEVSVGMTGRLNPTAVFDPIRLCGTTVSRATLHNQDFIDRLQIGIGDTVIVYKSGEIIPKIKASVPEKRPAGTENFRLPEFCPCCGERVQREEGAADICCVNPSCPAQLERHLINFVGRDAMDIKGLGEENIRALVREGYLQGITDLYRLKDKRDELIENGLVGREKNTDKLLLSIEESKKQEPDRLLTGLAVPNVGRTSAKNILKHFGTMQKLAEAEQEALQAVPDVGAVTAEAIRTFFANEQNRILIDTLRELGLNMEEHVETSGTVLTGRTYVITGDVTKFKNRAAFGEFIEARGGKLAGSVSKKTAALINNDAASQSGKNKKARELGIPIMTEEEFLTMVEELEASEN